MSNPTNQKNKEFARFDFVNHLEVLKKFVAFLRQQNKIEDKPTVEIFLDDLITFDAEFAQIFMEHIQKYTQLLQQALLPEEIQQEMQKNENTPERAHRQIQLKLIAPSQLQTINFRDVNPQKIGKLTKFNATCTFVSQNIPECAVATYFCERCAQATHILVINDAFKPEKLCKNCEEFKQPLVFAGHLSKFNQMRLLIIQEQPNEIPAGATPRTLQCVYKTLPEETQQVGIRPGDKLELTGYLLPMQTPQSVYRLDQIFHIETFKLLNQQTQKIQQKIQLNKMSPEELLNQLISSFAPTIYGNEMPKLACLCALVGGCSATPTDISIRQNVNLLLIGDPGVSKSQLLKYTALLSQRGIYISGRGATGAGLTAAVIRLPGSDQFSLEPGALILADSGVCCIDEFDKLQEEDRTAIYEVMEQQTISISKAGINASLNARTTVVSAANPRYSKWDDSKTLKENIDLPEALISRFDVVYVMRDFAEEEKDKNLAEFVARAHQEQRPDIQEKQVLNLQELKFYLEQCAGIKPQLKPELISKFVDNYVSDRSEKDLATPRALLSAVRLAQAIAKLRLSPYVEEFDVETARQLIRASEESAVGQKLGDITAKKEPQTASNIVKKLLKEHGQLSTKELIKKAGDRGVVKEQVEKVIERLKSIDAIVEEDDIWSLK